MHKPQSSHKSHASVPITSLCLSLSWPRCLYLNIVGFCRAGSLSTVQCSTLQLQLERQLLPLSHAFSRGRSSRCSRRRSTCPQPRGRPLPPCSFSPLSQWLSCIPAPSAIKTLPVHCMFLRSAAAQPTLAGGTAPADSDKVLTGAWQRDIYVLSVGSQDA